MLDWNIFILVLKVLQFFKQNYKFQVPVLKKIMDKFCLKWNDFQVNASKSFSLLKKDQDFFDVTLISDDDKTIFIFNSR